VPEPSEQYFKANVQERVLDETLQTSNFVLPLIMRVLLLIPVLCCIVPSFHCVSFCSGFSYPCSLPVQ
jgi:hypothetical protein